LLHTRNNRSTFGFDALKIEDTYNATEKYIEKYFGAERFNFIEI